MSEEACEQWSLWYINIFAHVLTHINQNDPELKKKIGYDTINYKSYAGDLACCASRTIMQSCILPVNYSVAFFAHSDYNVALYSASYL